MRAMIERATAEHLAEIAALAKIIWHAHYPGIISREQIDYMLAQMYNVAVMQNEVRAGIAYERLLIDGALRGFASHGPAAVAGELKLHKLYVHPEFQRRGWAALLLQRVEAAARAGGCHTVVLAVNKQNANAIAAYRKHGFTIRDSVRVDIGGRFAMDDYVMVKPLGR